MSGKLSVVENLDIGLEDESLKDCVEKTSVILAGTYALYLKTQYYHWNVVGAEFYNLHKMFEEQYEELRDAVDDIAERIRTLGGVSPGTFREFLELNFIEEDSEVPQDWREMVANLEAGHSSLAKEYRRCVVEIAKHNDEGTTDMFTQRIQVHEKTAWMLRSLLKSKTVS